MALSCTLLLSHTSEERNISRMFTGEEGKRWRAIFRLSLLMKRFYSPSRAHSLSPSCSECEWVCVLNRRRLLSVCKCCSFLWEGSWLTIQIRFWSNATTKKHISSLVLSCMLHGSILRTIIASCWCLNLEIVLCSTYTELFCFATCQAFKWYSDSK